MVLATVAYACPFPPFFWSKWYVPLSVTAIVPQHHHHHTTSPPPPPPLPPKPCTPHPVSGGDQLCQSRQATHTQSAGWQTKPLALPMKTSHASALSLSSSHAAVRGRHDTIVVGLPYQRDDSFLRERRRSWFTVEYFSPLLLLMS